MEISKLLALAETVSPLHGSKISVSPMSASVLKITWSFPNEGSYELLLEHDNGDDYIEERMASFGREMRNRILFRIKPLGNHLLGGQGYGALTGRYYLL